MVSDFVMPVTRLAKHKADGVPLDDDFYKSFYFAFECTQVRMIFDKDYYVQVRGEFEGQWYNRWTTVDSDFRQNEMIRMFSYVVNRACFGIENRHGLWSML